MMGSDDRTTDSEEAAFEDWSLEGVETLELDEVRFSRGFLQADPSRWVPSLDLHWKALLHSLDLDVEFRSVSTKLFFSEDLDRVIPIEVDGEIGVLGWDRALQESILSAAAPGVSPENGEIVLEYIERRLLATVNQSWKPEIAVPLLYLSNAGAESVEVTGSVVIEFTIRGKDCALWLGLGPRAVEKLDLIWREDLRAGADEASKDEIYTLSIEVAELAVHPGMLVDYLRSNTVIDLEIPVSVDVNIRANGSLWAAGKLKQFNNRFAVLIEQLNPPEKEVPDDTTRVQIELARTDVDYEALLENAQLGAILLSRTVVAPAVNLIISGESVGRARLGHIGGSFALNVLGK